MVCILKSLIKLSGWPCDFINYISQKALGVPRPNVSMFMAVSGIYRECRILQMDSGKKGSSVTDRYSM